MITDALRLLVESRDLSESQAADVMTEIMTGAATEAQIAAFAVSLRMKGETVDEIVGCARVMRARAEKINVPATTIADTCGTGGDNTKTFNVSTAAAFVVAGAGVIVAKHGNRAVSSKCGSADVLEALGVNIEVSPRKVEECITAAGIGFLFAPLLHGAMKYAAAPRRQIGVRTIFNILGPLTNPAGAGVQVLGVYSASLTHKLAAVLGRLGAKRAFVVHGLDSTDEISITGPTQISEYRDGRVTDFSVTPDDFGLKSASPADIAAGGNAKENAGIITSVLGGEKSARRDIVVANASAVLVAAGAAEDFKAGAALAAESIDSGAAMKKLSALMEICGK